MNIGRQSVSSALVAVAAVMVLLGTLYFASLRPGYSHISNTISELGEMGAAQAHWVAFGFFLPVGLIVWLALWLAHGHRSGQDTSLVLLALSGLGAGYVLSAFFPCDPGGPLFGSWRTLVHNAAGVIDYGGTVLGFLLFCLYCARHRMRPQAVAFGIAAALGSLALVLLGLPPAFPVRGAVQRVTELIQFTGLFFVCQLLSTRAAPRVTTFEKEQSYKYSLMAALLSALIRLSILLLILGCTAGCDQTSEHLARSGLDHFGSVALPGGFVELQLAENPGSFLSLGDSLPKLLRQALFTVGTGVCLLGLFAYLVYNRLGRYHFIGLSLIWAGGTSNLIDRITRQGLVTDFLFIRVGPFHTGIFNAADVMVMLGLAVLFYEHWKRRQADRKTNI